MTGPLRYGDLDARDLTARLVRENPAFAAWDDVIVTALSLFFRLNGDRLANEDEIAAVINKALEEEVDSCLNQLIRDDPNIGVFQKDGEDYFYYRPGGRRRRG